MGSIWMLVSLVMAEPSIEVETRPVTASPMTASEIYALLDEEYWSRGVIEARRLIEADPVNPLSHLTLGDALSHYPNGDGNLYAAFDAWVTAKKLSNPRGKMHRLAEERLSWALERSGIVKLEPSGFVGADGFPSDLTVTAFATKDVDWTPRIDRVKGGVYITNIPPGPVVLKVGAGSEMPIAVFSLMIEAGDFVKRSVATDAQSFEQGLTTGDFVDYANTGRALIDVQVQSLMLQPQANVERLASEMVTLPVAPVPVDSQTVFVSTQGERVVYDNGTRQTLVGGRYTVAVKKNGVKEGAVTYADLVVHPDLSIETLRNLVLNDADRRDTFVDPNKEPVLLTPSVEHSSAYGFWQAPKDEELKIGGASPNGKEGAVVEASIEPSVVNDPSVNEQILEKKTDSEPAVTGSEETVVTSQVPESDNANSETSDNEGGDQPEQMVEVVEASDAEVASNAGYSLVVETAGLFAWNPKVATTIERTTLAMGTGVALGAGFAMLRADHFADLANAETSSQVKFDEYVTKSNQWGSIFVLGSVALGNIGSFYIGSQWIEWRAVNKPSRQNDNTSPVDNEEVSTDEVQMMGEEQ